MIKREHSKKIIMLTSSLLLVAWVIYSYFFYITYNEAKIFATEGAQPIVQILEILNYRVEILVPYFIMFFALVSSSFLLLIYFFLFVKKYQLSVFPTIVLSFIILIIIGINISNKLFLFFMILIGVALLIMISITLTVKYLYIDTTMYKEGDIVHTKGPFATKDEAIRYEDKELKKLNKEISIEDLYVNSVIYLEDTGECYVDFYLENQEKE